MPDQSLTCAQLDAAAGFLSQQYEKPAPGGGSVLVDYRWHPAAGATRITGCNGPVISIRVRNNSTVTAWAVLPNKKTGNKWLQGDAGTDVTTSSPGQLTNLGLSNASDVAGVQIVFSQPV